MKRDANDGVVSEDSRQAITTGPQLLFVGLSKALAESCHRRQL
jgi:hypothetical protein